MLVIYYKFVCMWVQFYFSFDYCEALNCTVCTLSQDTKPSPTCPMLASLLMTVGVSQVALATQCLVNCHWISFVSPQYLSERISFLLHRIGAIRLRIISELSLNSSNSSFCAWMLHGGLDALLFLQFSHLHQLLSECRIPHCLGILLHWIFPVKGVTLGFASWLPIWQYGQIAHCSPSSLPFDQNKVLRHWNLCQTFLVRLLPCLLLSPTQSYLFLGESGGL